MKWKNHWVNQLFCSRNSRKAKASAADESANLINKANFNAIIWLKKLNSRHLKFFVMQQMKPKRVAIETEELKRQSRVFPPAWLQLKVSNSKCSRMGWIVATNSCYLQIQMLPLKVVEKVWMSVPVQMMQLHLMQLVNSLLMKWLNFSVALLKVISRLKISLVQKLMKQTVISTPVVWYFRHFRELKWQISNFSTSRWRFDLQLRGQQVKLI